MKEARATIRIEFPDENRAEIVFKALKPETETSPTQRSKVEIKRDEKTILLRFNAKDTTALRASINSYTRWAMVIEDVLSTLESLRRDV